MGIGRKSSRLQELPGRGFHITGRQLTAMVMFALFVFLLTPVGASATGGLSKVLITDPTNTNNKANVDASGSLQVGGTVNVGNSPTVSVGNSPTVNAQQSGQWNVGIVGTPTVTSGDQTTILASGSVLVDPSGSLELFKNLDISSAKEIRVYIAESGIPIGDLRTLVYGSDFALDDFTNQSPVMTKLYEVVGTTLTVGVFNSDPNQGMVRYAVVGRPN